MLVLFETPAGFAVFKLLDEKKLQDVQNLYTEFETPEAASQVVKLKHFQKFQDTTEALAATAALVEGKMGKSLKKLLKKVYSKEPQEMLAVADAKLGNAIKEKLSLNCVSNSPIQELMRCIRAQRENLITGLSQKDLSAMSLGLAHGLSRYKLKFSPDKVDIMIVQAISLLDDLDKELNNYAMRAREWYGWHFPELGKIITDNTVFAKVVHTMGFRTNHVNCDLSTILPEEIEAEVKEAAEISMGTEVSDEDILNIKYLCEQIIEITDYRTQLYDYLKNRMMAIAPNLTIMVGELVGARLIAHAGSLINLAKHPSSTVQILGAEKALFRALKTRKDTPKYGLIYHAALVGQVNPKIKGKMSRMLAAKASLAIRVDALGEDGNTELGIEHRAKLENRLKALEAGNERRISGTGKRKARWEKYENKSEVMTYDSWGDSTLPRVPKKRKIDDVEAGPSVEVKTEPGAKKQKRKSSELSTSVEIKEEPEDDEDSEPKPKKKKKKKSMGGEPTTPDSSLTPSSAKKKKKKVKQEVESD